MRLVFVVVGLLVACGGKNKIAELPDAPPPPGQDASVEVDAAVDAPPMTGSPHDPSGGITDPGEHGGAGCPDSDVTEFSLALGAATSNVFAGVVTGAEGNGTFYVAGSGTQELFGTIPTDAGGNYSVDVPLFCGAQLVKLHWTNATCSYDVVIDVTTDACVEPDIRITLGWDAIGIDWELHLIKPAGRINDNATDCTWTSCIGASPDWGVIGDPADDPAKDVDNTGAFGPENIVLRGPEPGTYTVMVEHWNPGGDPLSDGTVILNIKGQPITVVSYADLPVFNVWTAATITFPDGVVTTSQDVHDCTANWSNGCLDPIPAAP